MLYDFRRTFATRCVLAAVDLVTLAALLGHADVTMTMKCVHVQREQKIAAVDKLEKYVALAKKFKESREAEEWRLPEDEWGNPIYGEGEGPRVRQNPQQSSDLAREPLMQDIDF